MSLKTLSLHKVKLSHSIEKTELAVTWTNGALAESYSLYLINQLLKVLTQI